MTDQGDNRGRIDPIKIIDELDEWQDEWPQTGELSTDVRQNENIKFMLQRLEEQDDDIEALKDRLRAVELDEVGP